ncbi:MAG: Dabb family protein [Thermoguttaceae bacterium]|nr:Dabb family protein [Thermoguttaceae bacterium]MDW8038219.1 Dabb family protein [Thermoguttaceae bacterium]
MHYRNWSWIVGLGLGVVVGWLGSQTIGISSLSGGEPAAKAPVGYLVHDVYFTLKDKSPEAKAAFVQACQKYLAGHKDTVWFAAGVRGEEFQRAVNDQEFDVALQIVFKDKAAHDAYQEHPRHEKFIEENKDKWTKVRVFDWYIQASDHGPIPMPQK